MHENLMSTVSCKAIDNQIKEDYLHDNQWQTLASGNRFGSFFVLYGKLRGTNNGDFFMPNECDLYLQTFDGCLNIGLAHKAGNPIKMELGFHPVFRKFVFILRIRLEPLNTNNHLHRQSILFTQPESTFDYLVPSLIKKMKDYAKGMPQYNPLIIDMSFTDLKDIHISNTFKSQNVSPNSSNSPLINIDRYIREGSRILKISAESQNESFKEHFNQDDFVYSLQEDDMAFLDKFELWSQLFWTRDQLRIEDGIVLGFGCHPSTVRVMF